MEVEGASLGCLGYHGGLGNGVGRQRFEEERLGMGQLCSEEGLPKGVMAEATERKGTKRKVARRQPPSGLDEWDSEG